MKGRERTLAIDESRLQKRVAIAIIYRPRKPWSAEALLGGPKKLYSDESMTWKCPEQEQALTAIMSGKEQVVTVCGMQDSQPEEGQSTPYRGGYPPY
jgi:hypothetical protein